MLDADALADRRLERSVAAALRAIAAVHVERQAPPVRAARKRLGAVYGATRLAKTLERETRGREIQGREIQGREIQGREAQARETRAPARLTA